MGKGQATRIRREERSVKQIRVLAREGHSMADEVRQCITILRQEKIGASEGELHESRDGSYCGVEVEDSDVERAITILRARGFEVEKPFSGHAYYQP